MSDIGDQSKKDELPPPFDLQNYILELNEHFKDLKSLFTTLDKKLRRRLDLSSSKPTYRKVPEYLSERDITITKTRHAFEKKDLEEDHAERMKILKNMNHDLKKEYHLLRSEFKKLSSCSHDREQAFVKIDNEIKEMNGKVCAVCIDIDSVEGFLAKMNYLYEETSWQRNVQARFLDKLKEEINRLQELQFRLTDDIEIRRRDILSFLKLTSSAFSLTPGEFNKFINLDLTDTPWEHVIKKMTRIFRKVLSEEFKELDSLDPFGRTVDLGHLFMYYTPKLEDLPRRPTLLKEGYHGWW